MGRFTTIVLAVVLAIACVPIMAFSATASSGAGPVSVHNGTLWLNITEPSSGDYVGTSTVTVVWAGEDSAHSIDHYEVWVDNEATARQMDMSTSLTLPDLGQGAHTVIVRAINDVGSSVTAPVIFFVDTSQPALAIDFPANGNRLNTSDVTVRWTATDPSSISHFDIQLDNSEWETLLDTGQMSKTFPGLADGKHTVNLTAEDGAGKVTERSVYFYVDTTVPTVSIDFPNDNSAFTHSDVNVVWVGDDEDGQQDIAHYEVWQDGTLLTNASGQFFNFPKLEDGVHTIKIVAVDRANNTASDTVNFTVDTVKPQVTISPGDGSDGVPVDTVIVAAFSKTMNHANASFHITGVEGTTSWDGKNLTLTPQSLAYGTEYTVNLQCWDLIGNKVDTTWTFTTTDLGLIHGVVKDAEGNPVAGATVSLEDGTSTITDANGNYSLSAHAGEHTVTISKQGFETITEKVTTTPGEIKAVSDLRMAPSELIPMMGWVIAAAAVIIVAFLIFLGYRRKKMRGPPSTAKSWKGMEQLQKRANKGHQRQEDDEDQL